MHIVVALMKAGQRVATIDLDSRQRSLTHYIESRRGWGLVRETRRHRRPVDGALIDWMVVRNRASLLGSHSNSVVSAGLDELASRLGFRVALGFHERQVYRNLFPRGLTALDELSENMPGIGAGALPARREVQALLEALKLPIDERGRRRAALRAAWFASHDSPLDTDALLAGPSDEPATTK